MNWRIYSHERNEACNNNGYRGCVDRSPLALDTFSEDKSVSVVFRLVVGYLLFFYLQIVWLDFNNYFSLELFSGLEYMFFDSSQHSSQPVSVTIIVFSNWALLLPFKKIYCLAIIWICHSHWPPILIIGGAIVNIWPTFKGTLF